MVFFRFPLRRTAFWLIFITLMLPVEVRIIPTYAVMSDFGLINSFTGLTVPLIASATATLLFRQVFVAIPDELVEAARMDGAGPLRFLRDILIPVSAANIAALFVILFVYGWNQYLWPLLVATDPGLDTIVIGIVKMIGVETQTEWSAVMATAVLALLPPVAGGGGDAALVRQRPDGYREIMATLDLMDVQKAFGATKVLHGVDLDCRGWRDDRHRRRLRLRQVHPAADRRRPRDRRPAAMSASMAATSPRWSPPTATSPWSSRTTRSTRT